MIYFCYSINLHYLCTYIFIRCSAKLAKMIETLLLGMLIIAICMALLSIKLLFKKNGRFSSQHIHDNPGLRKQGIHCVIDQDKEARRKRRVSS